MWKDSKSSVKPIVEALGSIDNIAHYVDIVGILVRQECISSPMHGPELHNLLITHWEMRTVDEGRDGLISIFAEPFGFEIVRWQCVQFHRRAVK